MDLIALARTLIDVDSTTGREAALGGLLSEHLDRLARETGGRVERMPVAGDRFNVFAAWGEPVVVFSTHYDTVPPFFPSSEDAEVLRGRGACDTKGGIAAMLTAARDLLAEGREVQGPPRGEFLVQPLARRPQVAQDAVARPPVQLVARLRRVRDHHRKRADRLPLGLRGVRDRKL